MESHDAWILFFLCLLLSLIFNYLILKYSKKLNILMDRGNTSKPQRMHFEDIPRAGGIGIFISIVFALFYTNNALLLLPLIFIFASGILEDLHNSLSPKLRLFLQVLGASLAIYIFNCVITNIGIEIPYYLGVIFSIFCIVGISNSINIIDGFNGLAGGISLMALLSIIVVSYIVGDSNVFYISLALGGAIAGFLLLNFPYGKIFLGDGGAYLIGFIIAFLLIKLTQENNVSAWYGLCIMIYPTFEVIFSIYRKKVLRNIPATSPDSIHFHMLLYKRLVKVNYKTSIFIWILNIPFVFLPILFFNNHLMLIALSIVFIVLYVFIYFGLINFKSKKFKSLKKYF